MRSVKTHNLLTYSLIDLGTKVAFLKFEHSLGTVKTRARNPQTLQYVDRVFPRCHKYELFPDRQNSRESLLLAILLPEPHSGSFPIFGRFLKTSGRKSWRSMIKGKTT